MSIQPYSGPERKANACFWWHNTIDPKVVKRIESLMYISFCLENLQTTHEGRTRGKNTVCWSDVVQAHHMLKKEPLCSKQIIIHIVKCFYDRDTQLIIVSLFIGAKVLLSRKCDISNKYQCRWDAVSWQPRWNVWQRRYHVSLHTRYCCVRINTCIT